MGLLCRVIYRGTFISSFIGSFFLPMAFAQFPDAPMAYIDCEALDKKIHFELWNTENDSFAIPRFRITDNGLMNEPVVTVTSSSKPKSAEDSLPFSELKAFFAESGSLNLTSTDGVKYHLLYQRSSHGKKEKLSCIIAKTKSGVLTKSL